MGSMQESDLVVRGNVLLERIERLSAAIEEARAEFIQITDAAMERIRVKMKLYAERLIMLQKQNAEPIASGQKGDTNTT